MPARHLILALMVVAIWGFNFVVIKLSVNALAPMLAAGLRFSLACFPLLLFIRPPKTQWWKVVLFGLTFGFGLYSFLNFALNQGMPAGLASVVLQVQAFFTMIFAFFVLGERPKRQNIIGAAIAFCGIGVMAVERVAGAALLPFLLTIGAAICWGMANTVTKKMGDANAVAIAVWGSCVAALSLMAFSMVTEGYEPLVAFVIEPDVTTWGMLVFLAYPATLFGVGVWSWLLARYPAGVVAPFTLLVPITGLLSGWLLLGETISVLEMAGGALVVCGIGFSVFKRTTKNPRFA